MRLPRVLVTLALLAGCGDASVSDAAPPAHVAPERAVPAGAGAALLTFQGATRVQVLCLVHSNRMTGKEALQAQLCDQARTLVDARVDLPVQTIALGDPAVLDAQAVTVLLHAAVDDSRGAPLLVLALRTIRGTSADHAMLFGPAPRIVPLDAFGAPTSALAPALRAAIEELLPINPVR